METPSLPFFLKRRDIDQSDTRPPRVLIVLLVWPGRTSWSDKLSIFKFFTQVTPYFLFYNRRQAGEAPSR